MTRGGRRPPHAMTDGGRRGNLTCFASPTAAPARRAACGSWSAPAGETSGRRRRHGGRGRPRRSRLGDGGGRGTAPPAAPSRAKRPRRSPGRSTSRRGSARQTRGADAAASPARPTTGGSPRRSSARPSGSAPARTWHYRLAGRGCRHRHGGSRCPTWPPAPRRAGCTRAAHGGRPRRLPHRPPRWRPSDAATAADRGVRHAAWRLRRWSDRRSAALPWLRRWR